MFQIHVNICSANVIEVSVYLKFLCTCNVCRVQVHKYCTCVCVCVCVCARARACGRERERVCVCLSECAHVKSVYVHVCMYAHIL